MNNNKKLGLSISLTAIAAFSAGFVTAADHLDAPLIRALEAVGQNLFGEGNFGVSVVGAAPPPMTASLRRCRSTSRGAFPRMTIIRCCSTCLTRPGQPAWHRHR